MSRISASTRYIGSSPLVRGQQSAFVGLRAVRRIIPARAGPTLANWFRRTNASDHPRSCGANSMTCATCLHGCGSSPLVRGQPHLSRLRRIAQRIIPARAGPTLAGRHEVRPGPDHPRSCGANRVVPPQSSTSNGSSPLVRGQLVKVFRIGFLVRIIPARAGPTELPGITTACVADHPRSCGANQLCVSDMFDLFGSSPLVRGQRGTRTTYPAHIRIIPARAGPTYGTNPRKSDTTDHPRSCGANGTVSGVNQRQHGSSPLVRGQHAVRGKHRLPGRIIPARAGPT